MNANSTASPITDFGAYMLALLLIAGGLALSLGLKLPFAANPRTILVIFLAAGLLVCTVGGIGRVSASGAWWHPFSIIGYLLGVVILVIGITALFGRNIPPLRTEVQSITAVALISALKLVLTIIHRLFL